MSRIYKCRSLICSVLCMLLIFVTSPAAQQGPPAQDIVGGAELIFGRAKNPTAQSSKKISRSSAVKDNVDDALALGNAARDRNPPDLASAEKAYLLAWKLNPFDPRPYVGLGNIYIDQRRYVEAAKAYQNAIRFGDPAAGRGTRPTDVAVSSESPRAEVGEWHAYRGLALIAEKNLRQAEQALTNAIAADPRKPEWRAALAYCLFAQGRFTQAANAYLTATQLDPTNSRYKKLLAEAESKAKVSTEQDPIITKRLEATIWETPLEHTSRKVTCQLLTTHQVTCTSMDAEVPYSNLTWQVQDGLLQLIRPSTEDRLCLGRMNGREIQLKCFVDNAETRLTWRQARK